ncbi:MAG TPA: pitrilysin family protein [Vulgatibacter sp.]
MTFLAETAGASAVRLPAHETHRLDNGMRVVIAPRHELPLVSVELLVETGSADDPPGKAGLASFTAGLLRRGTTHRSADEIDGAIEFVGGRLDTGAGPDATAISAGVTSEHLPLAMEIVADVALHPSFPESEFRMHKKRVVAFLAQALDDPGTVADRSMLGSLLPEGHPYAAPGGGTRKTVSGFQLAQVRKFHQGRYAPAIATLFVVGDVEPAAVLRLAKKHFGSWKTPAPQRTPIEPAKGPRKNQILIVHKAGATQAQVRFVGAAFTRKTDPAYFPTIVANGAFGGGFTSRLVDEIRVNRGLSYSVGTRLVQLREAGFFTFKSFTRNDTIGELLQVAIAQAEAAREKGFAPEEIARSKSYLAGLYPLRLETNDQIASALADARIYDLPDDWVERYRERLTAADAAQVDEAAREWFFARPYSIVLVGDERAIRKGLKDAKVEGEIRVVPIEQVE